MNTVFFISLVIINAKAYTYNLPFIIKKENEHEVLVILARRKNNNLKNTKGKFKNIQGSFWSLK